VYVQDKVGNTRIYQASDLRAFGFPTVFQFGASTFVALSSSANPSAYSQPVTFTATVTASSNVPTGSVNFNENSHILGTGILDANGVASFTPSSLTPGPHSIVASYPGDTNFAPADSSPLSQRVNQATTAVGLTSSTNPSSFGQPVTFTATVAPQYGGTATGTITFNDGNTSLATVAVSANAATFSTRLAAGGHSLTAVYSGDSNFSGSSSSAVAQNVSKATTTLTLGSSPNPSSVGQMVTFTAIALGQFGDAATGAVTFKKGTMTLGTATLISGNASLNTSTLGLGSTTVTAVYGGDTNFVGSTSNNVTQVVKKIATTTTVSSTLTPSFVGQSVTFTATLISSFGPPPPDGETVSFKAGATTLGTATLNGGTASVTTSTLAAGSFTITASYGGDTKYFSSSGILSQKVNKYATTTAVSAVPNPSTYGQSVTFTAAISSSQGAPPDGETVTFKSGTTVLGTGTLSGGTATFSTAALGVGSKAITAVYAGDATLAASSATITQKVNKAATTTTLTSAPNPSTVGQPVTFTATVSPAYSGTPSGSVTFKLGATTLATVTMSGVAASYTTSTLPSGPDTIKATYNGSATFLSNAASVVQTVN